MHLDPAQERLEKLRQHRVPTEPDRSLKFLKAQFRREVERPHKQVAVIVEVWNRLLPAALTEHTRLESYKAGVLQVAVDSSARLYELDRLLRQGLERQLADAHGGALRRVKLRVAPWEPPSP